MDISVVIPLFNEEESLKELVEWIESVLQGKYTFEVIMIDDGSKDGSWQVIESIVRGRDNVRGLKFRRNYGKSAALHCGFNVAKGEAVITMDADLQDNPEEIPELYDMIIKEGYDMVSGWKKKRFDPVLSKNLPSKFFNWTARRISKIKLHDFNCGLKAYKNSVIKSIEVYGEMHRYIPVLVKWAGFDKIGEKVVRHQERKYGQTKFGIERFMRGPLDLLSVIFISKFGKRPMHLFGTWGTVVFLLGFFFAAYLGIYKIIMMNRGVYIGRVTQSAYFYLSLIAMIIGTQLFVAGFLGELISRSASERNKYLIEKEI